MDLTRPFPTFLTTLAGLMRRATDERRILPPAMPDDMAAMHLAESHLISMPPQLLASQRNSLL